MNIGIISAEGYEYPPTRRLVESAGPKNHRIVVIDPAEVWPVIYKDSSYLAGDPDIHRLDVVLPRQGATVLDSSLTLVAHLSVLGIPLVNDLNAIRLTKDQFLTLQALSASGLPVPDTAFVNSSKGFLKVLPQLGGYPVVIKQVNSRVGEGVFLADSENQGRTILQEQLDPSRGLLIQRFIALENRKDIRVLVIGKEVAGAMELRPLNGDFRANYHLSRKSWPVNLPAELKNLSLQAAASVGLEIAGVDILVDKSGKAHVIEVNYSPGFSGLEAATGMDIAGRIIDYLEKKYGKNNP